VDNRLVRGVWSAIFPFSGGSSRRLHGREGSLEEEVLTPTSQIRMIGNIFCSGSGGSVSANDAASAKSTPNKGGKEIDEARELQQSSSRRKRLGHELAQLRAANVPVQQKRARDVTQEVLALPERNVVALFLLLSSLLVPATSRTQTAITATAR